MWILKQYEKNENTNDIVRTGIYAIPIGLWSMGRVGSSIDLETNKVSRLHCVLEVIDDSFSITDRSKYGTIVNGSKITTKELNDNDKIILIGYKGFFVSCWHELSICIKIDSMNEHIIKPCLMLGIAITEEITKETSYLISNEVKPNENIAFSLLFNTKILCFSWLEKLVLSITKEEAFILTKDSLLAKTFNIPKEEHYLPKGIEKTSFMSRSNLLSNYCFTDIPSDRIKDLLICVGAETDNLSEKHKISLESESVKKLLFEAILLNDSSCLNTIKNENINGNRTLFFNQTTPRKKTFVKRTLHNHSDSASLPWL